MEIITAQQNISSGRPGVYKTHDPKCFARIDHLLAKPLKNGPQTLKGAENRQRPIKVDGNRNDKTSQILRQQGPIPYRR